MIKVVAIGSVDIKLLKDLKKELENTFGACKLEESIALPYQAYNKSRKQYLSDLLLKTLEKIEGEKILGVTDVDIYTNNLNFIFGQAYVNGKCCLISLYRLYTENYGKFLERAVKEATHELGHCFGLKHCENRNCDMSFSNNIFEVDMKSRYFCEKCRWLLENSISKT